MDLYRLRALWSSQPRYSPLLPAGTIRSSHAHSFVTKFRFLQLLVVAFLALLVLVGTLQFFAVPYYSAAPAQATDLEITPSFVLNDDKLVGTGDLLDDTPEPQQPDIDFPPSLSDDDQETSSFALHPDVPLGDYPSLGELHNMVSQTKGYFARDYSLGLGWNNVRYIIEAALLQAQILNRTLVLPTHVFVRACEYDLKVCADHAPMVNRGDAIGWDEWRSLPIEEQMAWRMPIERMVNITKLRQAQPVVRASEFFLLQGLPENTETSSGWWNRDSYHQPGKQFGSGEEKSSSLFVIENDWYDPRPMSRVDRLSEGAKIRGGWSDGNPDEPRNGSWTESSKTKAQTLLDAKLSEDRSYLEWHEARSELRILSFTEHSSERSLDVNNDEDMEIILQQNGWEILYTFQGATGMDYTKTVVELLRHAVPRASLRGLYDDFAHVDADVVVLAGETHLYRKPGALRFMVPSERENFARMVLHNVAPVDKVLDLARKLDRRISELNDGRMWVGAHMRRGDFVTIGWTNTPQAQLDRVKEHLSDGRKSLREISSFEPYPVPEVEGDSSSINRGRPEDSDRFFIATDEHDPEILRYFKDNGAIMFRDLVTIEDHHEFGWPLMFTDIVGLVEQATLARAAYFYGSAMSSFSGGVINMRSVLGADRHTALVD